MGNEQAPEEQKQNAPNEPTMPKIPILQESNIKYFGKRWRTDHDKYEEGILTIFNDGSVTFVNTKTNAEQSIPISRLTGIGECTITIEYPVTLLIISYNAISKNKKKSIIDIAFLLPDAQMWIDVLHYQTKLEPKNIIYTPECPICLMEVEPENYTYLINCNHLICQYCLFNYIKSQIKDASKYPMKCFNFKCDVMLHMNDVHFAFSRLPNAKQVEEKELKKEENANQDEKKNEEDIKEAPVNVENIPKNNFDEVNCICGKPLDKINSSPYNKNEDEPANIWCDICETKIKDDTSFYHC
eukprot:49183_1